MWFYFRCQVHETVYPWIGNRAARTAWTRRRLISFSKTPTLTLCVFMTSPMSLSS